MPIMAMLRKYFSFKISMQKKKNITSPKKILNLGIIKKEYKFQ